MVNQIFNIIGSPVFGGTMAVLSIALTIIIYYKTRHVKGKLTYGVSFYEIVNKKRLKYQDISILYKGQETDIFSRSQVVMRYSGASSIKNQDVAPLDPVILNIDSDVTVFEVSISYVTNENIGLRLVKLNDNKYKIEFDFLDHKDGFVINILNNIEASYFDTESHGKAQVKGTIIGVGKVDWRHVDNMYSSGSFEMLGSFLISFPIAGFMSFLFATLFDVSEIYTSIFFAITLIIVSFFAVGKLYDWNYRRSQFLIDLVKKVQG